MSETTRTIDRGLMRALGVAEIISLIVLVVFTISAGTLAQSIQLDTTPKKHVVYNYDPTQPSHADLQMFADNQRDLAVLTTEVGALRDEVRSLKPVETEGRISRLEATLDTVKQLLIGISVAVGLMLVQSLHTIFKPKEAREESIG